MRINGISSQNISNKKFDNKQNVQNPINNNYNYDSVSFGANEGKKKGNGLVKRIAALWMAAYTLLTGCAPAGAQMKDKQEVTTPPAIVQTADASDADFPYSTSLQFGEEVDGVTTKDLYYNPEIIDDYSTYSLTVEQMTENNAFQIAQNDCPSIAFDFTDNYKARVIAPLSTSVTLVNEDQKNKWYEFTNLNQVIDEVYNVKKDDTEIRYMIGYAILKANPEMAKEIMHGQVNYADDEITNVDPELVLTTDYTTSVAQRKIFLPEVNVFEEMRNDHDTVMVLSTDFKPIYGDENYISQLEITEDMLGAAKTTDEIISVVERALAKEYGIETMSSLAGKAIWHGVSIWENNEEAFKKVDEEDVKTRLAKYILANGGVTLECPRVAVTVMDDEDNLKDYGSTKEMLCDRIANDVTVSYLTPDRAVLDMSDWEDKSIMPIDVLDLFNFTDGVSIREAFEENNDKYRSLVLSSFRQVIDNNDYLREMFANDEFELSDLYIPIDFSTVDAEDAKINLQPLAFAQIETYECANCNCNKPGEVVHDCPCIEEETPEIKDPVKPDVTDPIVTDPIVTDPIVTDPIVTDPIVTDPIVTDPIVTDPIVTDPIVTDPIVTDPIVTDPIVTDPIVTDPIVTDPIVTTPTTCPPNPDVDPDDDDIDIDNPLPTIPGSSDTETTTTPDTETTTTPDTETTTTPDTETTTTPGQDIGDGLNPDDSNVELGDDSDKDGEGDDSDVDNEDDDFELEFPSIDDSNTTETPTTTEAPPTTTEAPPESTDIPPTTSTETPGDGSDIGAGDSFVDLGDDDFSTELPGAGDDEVKDDNNQNDEVDNGAQEEGSDPSQEEGSEPSQEEGSEPSQEEGSDPSQEEGSDPSQEEGSDPTEGEGSDPSQDGTDIDSMPDVDKTDSSVDDYFNQDSEIGAGDSELVLGDETADSNGDINFDDEFADFAEDLDLLDELLKNY